MEEIWRDVVLPFVRRHPRRFSPSAARLGGKKRGREPGGGGGGSGCSGSGGGAPDLKEARRAYLWATAAVAAYSFELGDDGFQAIQITSTS